MSINPNKDFYGALDATLTQINKILNIHPGERNTWASPEINLMVETRFELNDNEQNEVIQKLIDDGYIIRQDGIKPYKITFSGYDFINEGMYTKKRYLENLHIQQLEKDRAQVFINTQKLISGQNYLTAGTVALCLVGIAAILWDMYKYWHPINAYSIFYSFG